jgi:hypothetical protein
MSSYLPARRDDVRSSRHLTRAAKKQRRAELTLFEAGLDIRVEAEIEQIEARALGEVVRTAIDEEVRTLQFGLERGEGSQAVARLVANKVELLSRINDQRLAEKFGRRWGR